MKSCLKKTLCVLLSAVTICASMSVAALAVSGGIDYTIVNPYRSVDFASWEYYKANLHTHTNASDGTPSITEMVEHYYGLGYDVLSITDHGVINTDWRDERETYPLFNAFADFEPMSREDYERITTGADRGGRGMTDVTGGIETAMAAVSKTHVNGYFTTFGQGWWGIENDYKTAPVEIEKTGGVSVLNHIGDWTDSENYPEISRDPKIIAYFADIFTSCQSCLGLEIVNSNDRVTRADRVLWDELLEVVLPTGRNIWGFSNDDSEQLDEAGRSFEMMLMPENNMANVRTAMETGTFFACTVNARTELGGEFKGTGEVPLVKNIIVDQRANTIELVLDETRDCSAVEWVCGVDAGNEISKVVAAGTKIDLNDFEDELTCYIRFQLKGEGGITFSQAFELEYKGRRDKPIPERAITNPFLQRLWNIFYQTKAYAVFELLFDKIKYRIEGK